MAVRTYITETEFAKIDNPQSSTTYIVLDDNDPTLVKKVVFKTNNINNEGEIYIVQDEYPTPSGAVEITANANNIDVKQYATANVNVPNPSTGTLNITSNATYDVKNYAFAEVDVPQPSGKITITSNGTDIDITQYAAADVNVAQPTPVQKTCSFKFNSDGQFQFNKLGTGKYYLKTNNGQWVEYDDTATIDVYTNDVIELKSDVKQYLATAALSFNDNPNSTTAVSWEVEGDLLGALYGDMFPIRGCYEMFKNCTGLTKVPNDMFDNYEYVPDRGCQGMFQGCNTLTTAPELPATTLSNYCYYQMFNGCTSLTTAPELPAITLTTNCYYQMFYRCTSLTAAPALPATTLANYCYDSMFKECTSLTTAPALPATTLANYCYDSMFYDCTSLTTAPALPATILVNNCYANMFSGCKGLTSAPELPATTLASSCYTFMFNGCSSLNYIKCLATNPSSNYSTNVWVWGVAATGTFVKDANTTWPTGNSGIPSGWTVQDAA